MESLIKRCFVAGDAGVKESATTILVAKEGFHRQLYRCMVPGNQPGPGFSESNPGSARLCSSQTVTHQLVDRTSILASSPW